MADVLPAWCTENQPEDTTAERSEATLSDLSSPLVQLPDDALQTVCEHLPPTAVAALGSCCRRLRDATAAPHVWRRFCQLRWRRPLTHLTASSRDAEPLAATAAAAAAAAAAASERGTAAGSQLPVPAAATGGPRQGTPGRNASLPAAQPSSGRKRRRPDAGLPKDLGSAEPGQSAAPATVLQLDLPHTAAAPDGKQHARPATTESPRPAKMQRLDSDNADAAAPEAAAMSPAVAAPAAIAAAAGDAPAAAAAAARPSAASSETHKAARGCCNDISPAPRGAVPAGCTDWRRLYASGNGWDAPRFRQWQLPPCARKVPYDFVSSLEVTAAAAAGLPAATEDVALLACSDRMHAFDTGCPGVAPRLLGSCALRSSAIVYSVAAVGGATVAAGMSLGDIQLLKLTPAAECDDQSENTSRPTSSLRAADIWSPVVDLRCHGGRLLALHDATFSLDDAPLLPQRNVLRTVDLGSQAELGTAADFLESYELVAFDVADPEAGAHDIVAGAVHGGFCGRCFRHGLPSLCHHKSPAHAAALCTFDARAGPAATKRFGLHHRSLYPNLRVVRQHYVLTSHAGAPLAVWDRRRMSCPVYEEEHLPHFPGARACAGLPLPPPARAASHQGLFLDSDGDRLVGRAENGMLWTWDLTRTLGWQSLAPAQPQRSGSGDAGLYGVIIRQSTLDGDGGAASCGEGGGGSAAAGWAQPGIGAGCWLSAASLPEETRAQVVPWPAPLGALPCDGTLPLTVVRAGAPAQLFCLAALPAAADGDVRPAGEDCVVALSLL